MARRLKCCSPINTSFVADFRCPCFVRELSPKGLSSELPIAGSNRNRHKRIRRSVGLLLPTPRCSDVAHSLGRFFAVVTLESFLKYGSETRAAHALVRVARIDGYLRFSPASELVLLLADKLAVVLVDVFPAEYFFSRSDTQLRIAQDFIW
jgi:hypothetical protein